MEPKSSNLSTRQKKAIAALIQSPDKKAAAEMAGVGYRTLNRWLNEDQFLAELRLAESEIMSTAIRGLVGDLETNLQTMREIRDDEETPVNVRLRAAQVLDQSLLKWREALDIEQRIERLERAVLYDK